MSARTGLPLLLGLAVPLALAACNGAEEPFAPTGESPIEAAAEPVMPAHALAALTGQRIVFTSYRNGSGDLYNMDPQGKSLARLTSMAKDEMAPAWSRDNKRVAMVRSRLDASNTPHDDIYVINADGTNGHWARSTPSPYHLGDPSWSPDGSRLVLTLAANGTWFVGWMDLATGQLGIFNAIGGGWPGRKPSYDPTGKKIVYVGSRGASVEQINAGGTVHKVLVSSTNPVGDPTFSPDGKKLAFYKRVPDRFAINNTEIFVKSFVDGKTTRLTQSAGLDLQPSWSPDGSRIAFTSMRSGQLQIWTMNAAGGSLLRITHTATTEGYPAWSH